MPNSAPPMRHLPTLTEVVPPSALPAQPPKARVTTSPVLVDDVMHQLAPVLEAALRQSAQALVEAHVAALLPQAMAAVRSALEKSLEAAPEAR